MWAWRLDLIGCSHLDVGYQLRIGLHAYPLFNDDEDSISSPAHGQRCSFNPHKDLSYPSVLQRKQPGWATCDDGAESSLSITVLP